MVPAQSTDTPDPERTDPLTTPREYITVRPTDTQPSPQAGVRMLERLHGLGKTADDGVFEGLVGGRDPPVIELLLVGAPGETAPVTYQFGLADPGERDVEESLDHLERLLRSSFPAGYDLSRTEQSLLETLGLPATRPHRNAPVSTGEPSTASTADAGTAADAAATATAADDAAAVSDDPPADGNETTTDDSAFPESGEAPDQTDPTDADSTGAPPVDVAGDGTDDTPAEDTRPISERMVGGLSVVAEADWCHDWQTRLTGLPAFDEEPTEWPLTSVAAALAETPAPAAVQILLRPKPDWSDAADSYRFHLREYGGEGPIGRLVTGLFRELFPKAEPASDRDDRRPGGSDRTTTADTRTPRLVPGVRARLEELQEARPARSFDVNVRAVAFQHGTAAPEHVLRQVATAIDALDGTFYGLAPRRHPDGSRAANRVLDRLVAREFRTAGPLKRRWQRLEPTANVRPEVVAGTRAAAALCLLDGASLPPVGQRALRARGPETTGLALPPADQLATYRTAGLSLGYPKTADNTVHEKQVAVPPAMQSLHAAILGTSGSGKSTLLTTALLDNAAATDGLDLLIAPKGGGLPEAVLRGQFARTGALQDVYYCDCTELLPAIAPLSITTQLAAGIPRETAVENVIDRYLELARALMEEDAPGAARAPSVLRNLLQALFDPEHGGETVTHADLEATVERLHTTQDPPAVSDDRLAARLRSDLARDSETLTGILGGVSTRIEQVSQRPHLDRLFTYDPERAGVRMDLPALLDEDALVILDMGGLAPPTQAALTRVIVGELWTALRLRQRRAKHTAGPAADPELPLVNLYLDEAALIEDAAALDGLLARGREFGVGVTLALQHPGQLSAGTEAELLSNVTTIVAGQLPDADGLARRLATERCPPSTVANRLRALDRGEWLVTLPQPYREETTAPFVLASPPLPPGHPDGPAPLAADQREPFETAVDIVRYRTATTMGLSVPGVEPIGPPRDDDGTLAVAPEELGIGLAADASGGAPRSAASGTADGAPAADTPSQSAPSQSATAAGSTGKPDVNAGTDGPAGAGANDETVPAPIETTLPHTDRMPDCVGVHESGALVCQGCGNRYQASGTGIRHAIECCNSTATIDRDDVPVVDVDLKLTAEEVADSDYSPRQLAFLQVVHDAQHDHYTDIEYDITRDSMRLLRDDLGLDPAAVEALVAEGLLTLDCEYPHKLYSVRATGREAIGEALVEGVDYGDGVGDLGETSHHRLGTALGKRWVEATLVADDDSPAVEAVRYHPIDDGRLDVAALDADGSIVGVCEVERATNDLRTAVPADYDKMAACEPETALWVVPNRETGHAVLEALNSPADNVQRVAKTYSSGTPPRQFRLDAPGCTAIHTMGDLINRLEL